jgi:hypothetical protein
VESLELGQGAQRREIDDAVVAEAERFEIGERGEGREVGDARALEQSGVADGAGTDARGAHENVATDDGDGGPEGLEAPTDGAGEGLRHAAGRGVHDEHGALVVGGGERGPDDQEAPVVGRQRSAEVLVVAARAGVGEGAYGGGGVHVEQVDGAHAAAVVGRADGDVVADDGDG